MKKIGYISALVLLMSATSSFAALDLELTQGFDGAIPIAIVPFAEETGSNPNELSAIVNADLGNSGRFRVMEKAKMPEQPHDVGSVQTDIWKSHGMDYVVIGKVSQQGNQLHVSFQLVDIYGRKGVLLNRTFSTEHKDARSLAHHISDEIYENLIGKKGAFSTHIAYVLVQDSQTPNRRYNLIVADADGYNQQKLLASKDPIMSPRWSPDGSKLAYVSFEGKRASIYIQEAMTGQRYVVAAFEGINGAPAWSPDSRRLAMVLSKTGVPKIYVMTLGTDQLTQVTTGSSIDTEPRWTPDGKGVIFTSNRSGGPQIYRVGIEGGEPKRLTFSGNYNASGVFTPDGKFLVLLHQENGVYSIGKLNLADGRFEILTDTNRDQSPSIAPNGEMILYATKHDGRQVLGMVSIDGRIRLRLPAQEGDVREPAWSTL
ncbi:MAG: Tol-Pal system beta propeller repeat protein TolB [Pseudomonadota bacterium]|nr:Tol-Pal system beta propeller repeat protein TolB [Pseudomonadota bacterium]